MNQTAIWILAAAAAIVAAVLLFNLWQENLYRKKIREQFGHSDRDALMEDGMTQVRDAQGAGEASAGEAYENPIRTEEPENDDRTFEFSELETPAPEAPPAPAQKLMMNLAGLQKTELSWFHPQIDYRACVSLKQPRELSAIPRLSVNRRRVCVVGCTLDGHFQVADPIPGVLYQAFVIGLQTINRSGLISRADLEAFGDKVKEFAARIDGGVLLTDIDEFLQTARKLDDLCARVDRTIPVHLLSNTSITGTELRAALERHGFELAPNGSFYWPSVGESLFEAANIEEQPFTSTLLAAQNYRGITLIFDITRVPAGQKRFDKFMDLAVRLSGELNLDLVDEKLEELSLQWLNKLARHVAQWQDEMRDADILPGTPLAERVFS